VKSTYDDWQRIVQLDAQPVLRNLLISQRYYELSAAFTRMLGPANVTWFTFAAWSSKVVGQYLQNDQLPALLRKWVEEDSSSSGEQLDRLNKQLKSLHADPKHTSLFALDAAVRCAINDLRMYLALGNTQVFAELAPVFGHFLTLFGEDAAPDLPKLEQYLATLDAGPSEPDQVAIDPETHQLELIGRGGQALLCDALRCYYSAKFENDPKRRAERILLGSANIGLHEQTRLQTYIVGSLSAPINEVLIRTTHSALAEHLGTELLGARGYAMIDRLLTPIADHVQLVFRRFATELLMTLKLPDGTLHLGRDLPSAPGQPLFPPLLKHIEDPTLAAMLAQYNALAERSEERDCLRFLEEAAEALFARLGLGRFFALGSGADDWTSLSQRMRYILELFRSRQQNQRLLEPTFTPQQVAEMQAGRIPEGPLV